MCSHQVGVVSSLSLAISKGTRVGANIVAMWLCDVPYYVLHTASSRPSMDNPGNPVPRGIRNSANVVIQTSGAHMSMGVLARCQQGAVNQYPKAPVEQAYSPRQQEICLALRGNRSCALPFGTTAIRTCKCSDFQRCRFGRQVLRWLLHKCRRR